MQSKHQKTIIFLLLLFFFLTSFGLAFAQEGLEVDYPDVPGVPTPTVKGGLPNYVKYIFNFAIAFAGLVAFVVLVLSGVQYVTSAGSPEALKSAKSRVKSVFLGVLILLLSYILLTTINPGLIIFQVPGLQEIPSTELPETPIEPMVTTDPLRRLKEMAEIIKEIPDEINGMAERIQELTDDDHCKCENTQSLCFCTGGGSGDSCQPRQCYAGPGFQPCPDEPEIKENQKTIVAWKDEILYHRNRAIAESEDLKDNIEKLDEEINWYNIKIAADEEVLKQIEDDIGKRQQQKLIDASKEERDWLIEERDYKEELKQKLNELTKAIAKVEEPVNEVSQLPDECLVNVKDKCNAYCKGGCHDIKEGCQPDRCDGGNPCPTDEIQNQVTEINALPREINSICDEIITIINNIEETKEREIQL